MRPVTLRADGPSFTASNDQPLASETIDFSVNDSWWNSYSALRDWPGCGVAIRRRPRKRIDLRLAEM